MSKFAVGDRVRKVTGYPFKGVVCAAYATEEKCCVKHADQWEHIFSDKQLDWDHPEYQYLDLLKEVLDTGTHREGRNGGTRSLFGRQIRFNLKEGFPLLTTKNVHVKSVVGELLWFLSGSTNIKPLQDQGIRIWNEWADENGELGPVYGKQWRDFSGVDQISKLIENLKKDPYSRRHVVSAWNPAQVDQMALPPCHILFQFYVNDGKLSCQLYQRSADIFLGVPFNIASYALLTHMIAREVDLDVGEIILTFGDIHLYDNHVEQAQEQLTRRPLMMPYVHFPNDKSIFNLGVEDIEICHYFPLPTIKAPVSK